MPNLFREHEMSFNNFNSTIGNQVIGTLNIGSGNEGHMAFIQQQLNTIQERIKADAANHKVDVEKAFAAIEEFRRELASSSPKVDILKRSLGVIDGISSVASLVSQIRSLLNGVF